MLLNEDKLFSFGRYADGEWIANDLAAKNGRCIHIDALLQSNHYFNGHLCNTWSHQVLQRRGCSL